MKRGYVIGLDMGGTNVRTAAVLPTGKVLLMRRAPSRACASADEVAANIASEVSALEAAARARGWGRARAIGVAVPGPLNVFTGTVMAAPHVKAWRAFPLRRRLEAALGRTVVVENDANAWALGEFWRGAARGYRNVVLLTLGTGVGGGVIASGQLLHGRSGMAGELGHVTVEPDGLPCDCGARGCLEAYASSCGMLGLVTRSLGLTNGSSPPAEYLDPEGNFSVRALTARARAHDQLALEVLEAAGRYLGIGIASFLNMFNPELVVIGGGV
ncbi:MAG TPA: ROK family protein, partial [Candidatus Binataceae bacterium]|nr:ROK family protein [Candidatus Binataceae bacterium]